MRSAATASADARATSVMAAGVLGTVKLLLRCKAARVAAARVGRLGNSCAPTANPILGSQHPATSATSTRAVAITSSASIPSHDTHVEVVRLQRRQRRALATCRLLTDGGGRIPRWLNLARNIVTPPLDSRAARCAPFGMAASRHVPARDADARQLHFTCDCVAPWRTLWRRALDHRSWPEGRTEPDVHSARQRGHARRLRARRSTASRIRRSWKCSVSTRRPRRTSSAARPIGESPETGVIDSGTIRCSAIPGCTCATARRDSGEPRCESEPHDHRAQRTRDEPHTAR